VLVVGDVMLDEYVMGTVNRISPEAPVPVVRVRGRECRPGGAANVAFNIQALGGQAVVAGVVGKDAAGADLVRLLKARGIRTDGILATDRIATTVKTRILAERQQVVRIDNESDMDSVAGVADRLAARAKALVSQVAGVIIEDYGKGVICQPVLDAVLPEAIRRGKSAGFDPKDNHDLMIQGITMATPNYKEACWAAGAKERPLADGDLSGDSWLRELGDTLLAKWQAQFMVITLGAHGMYVLERDGTASHIPTRAREVFDVSGAGDTVIAAAVLGLASGASHYEALSLANFAAGVVVGKLGTATCSPAELLEAVGWKEENPPVRSRHPAKGA
jgi:D-beta-D-heptose 7-phosphate kinase/D-beta-D-heptose 1-phosphate adenosyltransferase